MILYGTCVCFINIFFYLETVCPHSFNKWKIIISTILQNMSFCIPKKKVSHF